MTGVKLENKKKNQISGQDMSSPLHKNLKFSMHIVVVVSMITEWS
jgi:hypothetical protein